MSKGCHNCRYFKLINGNRGSCTIQLLSVYRYIHSCFKWKGIDMYNRFYLYDKNRLGKMTLQNWDKLENDYNSVCDMLSEVIFKRMQANYFISEYEDE